MSMRYGLPLVLLGALVFGTALGQAPPKNPHGNKMKEECGLCHSPEGWVPARLSSKFDHAKYGLPLTGAHKRTPCKACHGSLDFAREQAPCGSCHEDVHKGELGQDCASCHTTRSFIDRVTMEKQHQLSRFPLTGAHVALDCEECHPGTAPGHLSFVARSFACEDCHLEKALAVQDPNHQANGFLKNCDDCHNTGTWTGAGFDHSNTAFPLTGAHRPLNCSSCHAPGTFTGLSPQCVSCHQQNYDNTSNPGHSAIGFSTDCASCHNTTSWDGAHFDHTWFPIYSGTHAGRWSSCNTCHNVAGDYTAFTCLTCHPHSDRTETDGHHQGLSGYSYDSAACYRCHPTGRAGN